MIGVDRIIILKLINAHNILPNLNNHFMVIIKIAIFQVAKNLHQCFPFTSHLNGGREIIDGDAVTLHMCLYDDFNPLLSAGS